MKKHKQIKQHISRSLPLRKTALFSVTEKLLYNTYIQITTNNLTVKLDKVLEHALS